MEDIVTEYVRRRRTAILLILGVPVEESNHHVYAESFAYELKKHVTQTPIQYYKVVVEQDIKDVRDLVRNTTNGDGGFIIISSNFALDMTLESNFTIFFDTPETVLAQRGLDNVFLNKEHWDKFKKTVNISKFVNDYNNRGFTDLKETTKPGKPWQMFFSIWRTVMRLITESLHKEDLERFSQ